MQVAASAVDRRGPGALRPVRTVAPCLRGLLAALVWLASGSVPLAAQNARPDSLQADPDSSAAAADSAESVADSALADADSLSSGADSADADTLSADSPPPEPPVRCELVRVGGYTLRTRLDSIRFVHHANGGIDYRCSDGMLVLADSAAIFEATEQVHLFGRVHLEDAETELDADTIRYFGGLAQVNAWSRVVVKDRATGAIIEGDRMVYDRVTEVRPLDRMMIYGGSPHATIPPRTVEADAPAPDSADDAAAAGSGNAVADSADAAEPGDTASAAAASDTPAAPLDTAGVAAAPDSATDDATQDSADAPALADTLPPSPYEIDAERFVLEGRRYFRAGGNVVVVRDSMHAFGDSLDYDQEAGAMSVIGDARVDESSYTLTAATVSLTPRGGGREELLARRDATLAGEQVNMEAPSIRMFLEGGEVVRLAASGVIPPLPGEPQEIDTRGLSPGDAARVRTLAGQAVPREDSAQAADSLFRPSVAAEQFKLLGDSIDVLSPGQQLELVTAVGGARAEGEPDDSAAVPGLPEAAWRDWMEGDTVVARFASPNAARGPQPAAQPPPPDSARGSRLETLTAAGSARSLYRLADSVAVDSSAVDSTADRDSAAADSTPPGRRCTGSKESGSSCTWRGSRS